MKGTEASSVTKASLFPDAILTGEVLEHLRVPVDARYELVDGRIEVLTPTNRFHAEMITRLVRLIGQPAGWRVLAGDPGLYIRRRPDTVRGPDLIVISEARYQQTDSARAFLTVAPELVIEVVSPANEPEDIETKVREYRGLGCTVWVVDVDAGTLVETPPPAAAGSGRVQLPSGGWIETADIFPAS
jgi:Uma2 family endonuclease